MKTRALSSILTSLFLCVGCSKDVGKPKPMLPTFNADAAAQDEDTGAVPADTGVNASAMDSGAMTLDTGTPLTPSCMELAECCMDVPQQFQSQCDGPLANNIDSECRSTLDQAQMFGFCLPENQDGGTRPGPQGPRCEALLNCCPEIGIEFLQTACENIANDGNEGTCDMRLMQIQMANICLDPPDAGMTDAGTSTVGMDAGTSTIGMDAGTSTVGMDAGTSSAADAG